MANKKTLILIIAAVLAVAIGIGGYFYWNKKIKTVTGEDVLVETSGGAEKIIESASGGVLPDIPANPLEDKPGVNPLDETNPYKDIKTNPFE